MRDAGHQVARISRVMDRLAPVDQEAIRAFANQINAALEPLSPVERMCALVYAQAAQEATQ